MLTQVNRILCKRLVLNLHLRFSHNAQLTSEILYPLENRKLLKVSGNESPVFLQGLVTNDIRHFENGAKCIYAMFLNNKGKVLYDTLIYKWDKENSFLIECDALVLGVLQKHLKIYKLRRSVEIEDINKDFRLWVLISPENKNPNAKINQSLYVYKDPRLIDLGQRIITLTSLTGRQVAEHLGNDISVENNDNGYKYLRYKLGVSEGAEDLPPGSNFPLEINCDYLHGVSFHKGCYIGQELTARVHHTGVVRKRIIPLKFKEEIYDNIEKDCVITTKINPKANIGKLKGVIKDYGLGLVRIKEAFDAKLLNIGNYSVEVLKPAWWPITAPKEKVTVPK